MGEYMISKQNYLPMLLTVFILALVPKTALAQSSARTASKWSPKDLTSGPVAILGGAVAPLGCTLRYTLIPFEAIADAEGPGGSQAGIAIPFLPFVSLVGAVGGTVRGGMLFATGTADLLTGGAYDFSEPVLGDEIYTSVAWCIGGSTVAGRKKSW